MTSENKLSTLKLHNPFNGQIFSLFKGWLRYYICFCKAAGFASGLVFGYTVVYCTVLFVLVTYFTESSNYDLKKAAVFVNIWEGLSASLVFIYTSYGFLSHLRVLICSVVSLICGLVVLCFTASHLCPKSKSDIFNMIGVVLLAAGEAGVRTFLEAFLDDQLRAHEPNKNEDQVQARKRLWWLVAWSCGVVSSVYFFVINYSWSIRLIISASIMGSTLILFLLGIRFYHCKESARRGSRSTIFHVVEAFMLIWQLKILRRPDKPAIKEPSHLSAEDQQSAGRLITVREVQAIKLVFKMVPLWTNFVVLGLVVSAGNTLFPEQGNNMVSPNLLIFVLIVKSISSKIIVYLLKLFVRNWDTKTKKQAQKIKIWAGMMLSIFCCLVAWRVEVHRLIIVNKYGLLDASDAEIIPMSIFWLVPQFFLLRLMQSLATDGLNEFVSDRFPKLTEEYVKAINEFVIGIGSFLNILCVHANQSLFSVTLNHSRLDKYYKVLTVVSFINFCGYLLFISTIYTSGEGKVAGDGTLKTSGADEVDVV